MICNDTTWVPYYNYIATLCHQLRALYHAHNIGDLGGRNCATIYYRRANGQNLCHVTCSSESGVGAARHSERVCIQEMVSREGWTLAHAATRVICVYTERFPCGPQNHNCFNVLNNWLLPNTPVFWSFEWPDAKDLEGKDKKRKIDQISDGATDYAVEAKRARQQGTKDLKDYQRDFDWSSYNTGTKVSAGVVSDPMLIQLAGNSDGVPLRPGTDLSRHLPESLIMVGDSPFN